MTKYMRLKRGWSIDKAIETPLKGVKRYEINAR